MKNPKEKTEGKPLIYDSTQNDERDERLMKDLAALPKSRQPERDVWLEISRRITSEKVATSVHKGSSMRGWLAMAASVVLVVASSVYILDGVELTTPADQPTAAATTDHLYLNEIGARVPATSLEREYQAAFREFVRLDLTQAGPAGLELEAIRKDWQRMQQLEQELKAALELEPENFWLAQRLRQLHAHQLQLLRVIADTGPVPGRNLI